MNHGGDVFGVLRWGLAKYAWVLAVSVLALGVMVPRLLNSLPEQYEAEAQVGPTEGLNLPNLDALPRLGQAVFDNGAVAEAVRASLNPPLPNSVPIVPEYAELITAHDNIVFTVVGRGSSPRSATHLANVAAATFTQELNKYAAPVGPFAIQRLATPPGQPLPQVGGAVAIGIGVLAGLVAGVGLIALVLVWRRPVLDNAAVRETTGAVVLGRLSLQSSRVTQGLPQLARTVLSDTTNMLLLAGPHDTRQARHRLTTELTDVLGWTRNVLVHRGNNHSDRIAAKSHDLSSACDQLVIVDGPTPAELAIRPDTSLTLLLVREGIGQAALRREAETYLDGGPAGIVLVRGHSWLPQWRLPKSMWSPARKKKQRTAAPPIWEEGRPVVTSGRD